MDSNTYSNRTYDNESENNKAIIYAHRGCSFRYPENTLLSFEAAAKVKGIGGIEFDVQLTKDEEIVVIHDESVERTTDGKGDVRDYTLAEIKKLHITPSGQDEPYTDDDGSMLSVPSLREFLDLIKPYCINNNLMLNIELKNSVYPYTGMEQKVIDMVSEYGLDDYIIYSSFNHDSLTVVKDIKPDAVCATLDEDINECIKGMERVKALGVHPSNESIDSNETVALSLKDKGVSVRIWNHIEPLFGVDKPLQSLDVDRYAALGVEVVMTNVPEDYLCLQ